LLKNYFTDLDKLVNDLAKQVWYICSRALEAVQGNDSALHQLVSALRIIEREERFGVFVNFLVTFLDFKSLLEKIF